MTAADMDSLLWTPQDASLQHVGCPSCGARITAADLEPVLWKAPSAALRLGKVVSGFWLERQAAARAIPCTYLGKRLGFSEPNLAELLVQHRNDPATYGRMKR